MRVRVRKYKRSWVTHCMLLAALVALAIPQQVWAQAGFGSGRNPVPPPGSGGGPRPDLDFQTRMSLQGGPRYLNEKNQMPVSGVRVIGNESVKTITVLSYLRTKKERPFDPEILQADVRRLTASGLFRDVKPYTQVTQQGIEVTFEVFERPTIRYVKFIGNRGVRDKTLRDQAGIEEGDALILFNVSEARRKLEEYYHSNGFTKTQVVVAEGDKPGDKGAVFLIHEGQMQRVRSVSFVGNSVATSARLKTQVSSKPGWMYYIGGQVDRAKIERDVKTLTAYYRGLGYFNARVSRELVVSDNGKWADLTFVISEGPRYRIRQVSLAGNQKYTTPSLMQHLSLKAGEDFNLGKLQSDVNQLRDLYGSKGYIFADIQADPRFLEQPGELDLVYNIQEGKQFRVGKINVHIQGEFPHTRREVVLNRLSVKPGDIIDIRKIRSSERRLKASQLFANDPARNAVPRIVIRPPEIDDESPTFRGQSPDPIPGTLPSEGVVNFDIYVPPVQQTQASR